MATQLSLLDENTREDLRVFLQRLLRVGEPEVRILTRGDVFAVFGCTQAPMGLGDPLPVVLVSRGFSLAEPHHPGIDMTVQARSLLDRLARRPVVGLVPGETGVSQAFDLPDQALATAWAGVMPPTSGWVRASSVDAASLRAAAAAGVQAVNAALPEQPGEHAVRSVRARVWGSEILPGVPASVAFAADAMGFLQGERIAALATTRTWTRLTTSRGHVIVRDSMR